MIAVAISLLFGFATLAALLSLVISAGHAVGHAKSIMSELAQLEACAEPESGPAIVRSGNRPIMQENRSRRASPARPLPIASRHLAAA